MGFSVSGSAAILLIAAFVSIGILYSAAYNGFERVQDAENSHGERVLEQRNTVVEVTNTTYDSSADELTVNVTNRGSTELVVGETDLLVDGEFQQPSNYVSSSVDGNNATSLWLPGETYSITVNATERPGRVKVVTSTGVTATGVV
jgi:flagellar protein FlaF